MRKKQENVCRPRRTRSRCFRAVALIFAVAALLRPPDQRSPSYPSRALLQGVLRRRSSLSVPAAPHPPTRPACAPCAFRASTHTRSCGSGAHRGESAAGAAPRAPCSVCCSSPQATRAAPHRPTAGAFASIELAHGGLGPVLGGEDRSAHSTRAAPHPLHDARTALALRSSCSLACHTAPNPLRVAGVVCLVHDPTFGAR